MQMHRRDQILGRMYTFLCIDPILSNTFFSYQSLHVAVLFSCSCIIPR